MRAIDIVRKVAPHAQQNYLTAFEEGDSLLHGASLTRRRATTSRPAPPCTRCSAVRILMSAP